MSVAPQDIEGSEGIPAGFSSLWGGFPPCTHLQAEIPPSPARSAALCHGFPVGPAALLLCPSVGTDPPSPQLPSPSS